MKTPALHAALFATTLTFSGGALSGAPASAEVIPGIPGNDGRGAVPVLRVPGRGLVKLQGIDAHRLLVGKAADPALTVLKEIAARSGVALRLVRPVFPGWALVELRDPRAPDALPDEDRTLALLEQVAADPAVAKVADDKWYRKLAAPNDARYGEMWNLDVIGAETAWTYTKGASTQRIGVVDTGLLRAHEDVGARAVAGYDFVTQNGTDGNGRDADYNDTGDACPAQGQNESSFHGTHVAGTMAASTNNGLGVAGLNWNAGLVIARGLGACGGDVVDIMEGAAWLAGASINNVPAIGANKVSVMNLSLGSAESCSSYEQDVVDYITQQGVVFVAAAGNDGGAVGSPANCTGSIAVAAHGPNRTVTQYSSFGTQIAIVAPGGDTSFGSEYGILSSIGPTSTRYAFNEGTSMAAPHVAGAISLMQALDPTLTSAQIVTLMQNNGASCTSCSGKKALDLGATLAAISAVGPIDPAPVDPPLADDAYEENDLFTTAKLLACGAAVSLVAGEDDFDWFLVTAPAGAALTVRIHALQDDDLDLYAATGGSLPDDVIGSSETTTGDEGLSGTSDGSTLAFLVAPYNDPDTGEKASGPYQLTVECVDGDTAPVDDEPTDPTDPAGPGTTDPTDPGTDDGALEDGALEDDALEDNDAADRAQPLFCGQQRDLVANDDDWFAVDVRDLDDVVVRAKADGTKLELELLGPGDAVLGSASDVDAQVQAQGLAKGTYLVHVKPVDGAGAYALTVDCLPQVTDLDVQGGCSAAGGGTAASFIALLAALGARGRRLRRQVCAARCSSTTLVA